MSFTTFLKEKEEEGMNQEQEEKKAKVIAIFTEGEPVNVETVTAKAEEFEMSKEELENEIYGVLFEMLNVEDEDEEEIGGEEEITLGDEAPEEEL